MPKYLASCPACDKCSISDSCYKKNDSSCDNGSHNHYHYYILLMSGIGKQTVQPFPMDQFLYLADKNFWWIHVYRIMCNFFTPCKEKKL